MSRRGQPRPGSRLGAVRLRLGGVRLRLGVVVGSLGALLGVLSFAACGEGQEERARPGFELRWERPVPRDATLAKELRDAGLIDTVVEVLNEIVVLPEPVEILFRSGGGEAFYDERRRRIVVTYPFARTVAKELARSYPGVGERGIVARTRNGTAFVLLHEIGHALVDVLDLPVTASEEDSVDNLATVISIVYLRRGKNVALDFADLSDPVRRGSSRLRAVEFWDEHALDAQRANRTTCLVFGSDPRANRHLAPLIPRFRRERCRDEWEQIARSWRRLFEPHLADSAEVRFATGKEEG